MRKRAAVMVALALIWCVLPTLLHAAGGGKPATKLVSVADTRAATGLAKWVGDVYNTNLWLYGLVVVVVMAGMGLLLGLMFDRLLVLLGLELGKLDHHE
jgi:hypothetical protein